MSIFRTLVALASAAGAIFMAYAFGYGISNHHRTPFVLGGVALAATIALIVLQVKIGGKEPS